MGAYKTDNSLHVFVGADVDQTASLADVTAGHILIRNEANADHADQIADGEYFKVGQKDGNGNFRWSPLCKWDDTIKINSAVAVDRRNQSSIFGSNGSTGSIDTLDSNRFTLRVNFKNNDDLYSEQSDLHFFEYVSDANATEIEIADYFAQTMSKNPKFSGKTAGKNRASVKVERITSASDSTISADITTARVTNGSKFITDFVFGSGTDVSGMVAGNYLRIVSDGTVTDTPVAADDAIYKIVSVDNDNDIIELDQPFQGTTADLQDVAINQITASDMASANVGIKITALVQEFIVGLTGDSLVTFDVTLDGWGATTAVSTTTSRKGKGHSREVADLEWFAQGSAGAPYRHGVPNNSNLITFYTAGVDEAVTSDYHTCFIDAKLADPYHAVAGSGVGRVQILIFNPTGAASDVTTPFA